MTDKDKKLLENLKSPTNAEKAFSQLLDLYQERVYWFVRKITKDHELSNDTLQNTFIRVFKSIHSFKGNSSLSTWIFTIAKNEALRSIEIQKKHRKQSIEEIDFKLQTVNTYDEYFNPDKIQAQLHEQINSLKEKQRIIFQMHYFDELSFREIGEVLEIAESTVKTNYYSASKKIEHFFSQNQTI